MPNLRKGSRQYNANWVAVQKGAAHVEGNINGIPCQIVPDTGAEITIVPACYVYEDQAINEWVKVRGWNGEPAKVDFEYEGKSFLSTVAVAHEDRGCSSRYLWMVRWHPGFFWMLPLIPPQ